MFLFKMCMILLLTFNSLSEPMHIRGHLGFGECWMPNNKKGHCQPLKDCATLNKLTNKKHLLFTDRLLLRRSRCGHMGFTPLVCCQKSGTTTTRFNGSPIKTSDLPTECGRLHLNFDRRSGLIFGGNEARIYDSPWLALLQYSKSEGTGFLCSGALINKDYVLTAAHCVTENMLIRRKMKLISVRLGEWDKETKIDCQNSICSDPVLDIPIKEVIINKEYRDELINNEHDIALILLNHSVTTTNWIRPICLPIDEELKQKNYDQVEMTVAGWGHTESATDSNRKMQVTLKGISNEKCDKMYKRFNVSMKDGQFCAGGEEGFDSCRGDSGSPIIWYNDDEEPPRWYALGIVSFGLAHCAQANFAGVYTRIDKYIGWILKNMKFFE
ncbi:serine protease easter-like [Contarinia nasturtii]|uniref:serine protease easter-like n=1 Tax=Contarinia nasturtii TaxID=265458 RepID=UPI0012D4BA8B|nr:serine protease easter-like [Contarinia nasturtii]